MEISTLNVNKNVVFSSQGWTQRSQQSHLEVKQTAQRGCLKSYLFHDPISVELFVTLVRHNDTSKIQTQSLKQLGGPVMTWLKTHSSDRMLSSLVSFPKWGAGCPPEAPLLAWPGVYVWYKVLNDPTWWPLQWRPTKWLCHWLSCASSIWRTKVNILRLHTIK